MVRFLCLGDPHFKTSNVREMTEMTAKFLETVRGLNLDFCVCMGDILDRHSNIHVTPLTLATKFLKEIETICDLYIVVGNHDRPNNSNFCTDEHPFTACKFWQRTVVTDTTTVIERDGRKFVFVPYVPPGRFMEALELVGPVAETFDGCTCIFAHQEFYGAKMEEGIVSNHGDHWPVGYPLCISGHIHHYDDLQANLIYVGTPMQHEINDTSTKTVSVFTVAEDGSVVHERIDLDLPRRYVVYLRPEEICTYEAPANASVTLCVRGSQSEIDACKKNSRLKDFQKAGIKVKFKTEVTGDSSQMPELRAPSYLHALFANVEKEDALAIEWYHRLFGEPLKDPNDPDNVQDSVSDNVQDANNVNVQDPDNVQDSNNVQDPNNCNDPQQLQ